MIVEDRPSGNDDEHSDAGEMDSRSVISNISNFTQSETTDAWPDYDIRFKHFMMHHHPPYIVHVMHSNQDSKSLAPAFIGKLISTSYPTGIA